MGRSVRGMASPTGDHVKGSVKEERDGLVIVETRQAGGTRIIRNADAEIERRQNRACHKPVRVLLRKRLKRIAISPAVGRSGRRPDDGPGAVPPRAEMAKLRTPAARASPTPGPACDRPRLPHLRRRALAAASCRPRKTLELTTAPKSTRRCVPRRASVEVRTCSRSPPADRDATIGAEVLLLQPQWRWSGDNVDRWGPKRASPTTPGRPGLVDWAAYMNEALGGSTSARGAQRACRPRTERAGAGFIATLTPAFTELEDTA